MNFVIKSTFKYIRIALRKLVSSHHSVWILTANLIVSSIIIIVYYDNIALPATIGSRYYGDYYVWIAETGVRVIIYTTAYAVASIGIRFAWKKLKYRIAHPFLPSRLFRRIFINTLMLFNVFSTLPR